MAVRGMLTVADRAEISTGLKAGWSVRAIARQIGRAPSVVSREIARNSTKTRGYRLVHADCAAQRRRRSRRSPTANPGARWTRFAGC